LKELHVVNLASAVTISKVSGTSVHVHLLTALKELSPVRALNNTDLTCLLHWLDYTSYIQDN